MTGVRCGQLGFEGQCETCREWFPLDREFWPALGRGLRHCRACENQRRNAIARRRGPLRAAYNRKWRFENAEMFYTKRKLALIAKAIADPEWAERKRAYHREWMRRKRQAA